MCANLNWTIYLFQLMIGLDPWNIFSWKKYIFKHLKCIFKLKKKHENIYSLRRECTLYFYSTIRTKFNILFYFLDSILSTPVSSTNSDPKRILSLVQVTLNVKTALMTDLQPANCLNQVMFIILIIIVSLQKRL